MQISSISAILYSIHSLTQYFVNIPRDVNQLECLKHQFKMTQSVHIVNCYYHHYHYLFVFLVL